MGAIYIYHTDTHMCIYIIVKRSIDCCHLISDLANCLQFGSL